MAVSPTAEDTDSEYEESLVFVKLDGLSKEDEEYMQDFRGNMNLLTSSDTPETILQLGKYVFKGDLEDTPHTSMFFKNSSPTHPILSVDSFVCQTTKTINLHQVQLRKRTAGDGEEEEDSFSKSKRTDDTDEEAEEMTDLESDPSDREPMLLIDSSSQNVEEPL